MLGGETFVCGYMGCLCEETFAWECVGYVCEGVGGTFVCGGVVFLCP